MKYSEIIDVDYTNGEGIGISLFVQGCNHHCDGCFNPETWDFKSGFDWDKKIENEIIELAKKPYITRISVLGGEPLAEQNVEDVLNLLIRFRKEYPNKKIWVYTGYTYEEIMQLSKIEKKENILRKSVIENIDILVDGRFIKSLKDLTLKFRGSSNQRIIDTKKSLEQGDVVLWTD